MAKITQKCVFMMSEISVEAGEDLKVSSCECHPP